MSLSRFGVIAGLVCFRSTFPRLRLAAAQVSLERRRKALRTCASPCRRWAGGVAGCTCLGHGARDIPPGQQRQAGSRIRPGRCPRRFRMASQPDSLHPSSPRGRFRPSLRRRLSSTRRYFRCRSSVVERLVRDFCTEKHLYFQWVCYQKTQIYHISYCFIILFVFTTSREESNLERGTSVGWFIDVANDAQTRMHDFAEALITAIALAASILRPQSRSAKFGG